MTDANLQVISRTGVYGIAKQGEKFLLVQQKKGPHKRKWDLPGGGIQPAETIKEALLREFQEEVGMAFASMALWDNRVAITESIDASGLPYLFHQIGLIYVVEGVSCIPINKIELTYEWLQANELTKNELSPFALQALHEVKS